MKRGGGCFVKGIAFGSQIAHIHPYITAVAMGAPATLHIPQRQLRMAGALIGNAVPIPQGLNILAPLAAVFDVLKGDTPKDPTEVINRSIHLARPAQLPVTLMQLEDARHSDTHASKKQCCRHLSCLLAGPFSHNTRVAGHLEDIGTVGDLIHIERAKLQLPIHLRLHASLNGHTLKHDDLLSQLKISNDSVIRLQVYPLKGGRGCAGVNLSGIDAVGRKENLDQMMQDFDILAVQESHLTLYGQQKFQATHGHEWSINFGKERPPKVRNVPATALRSAYIATHDTSAAKGGVLNLAKFPQALVNTSTSDDIAIQLYNTSAWVESFAPLTKAKVGQQGLYLGNLYAAPGADNTSLFKQAQNAMVRNGAHVPYFLFGDFQCDVRHHPAWIDAFTSGTLVHISSAIHAEDNGAPTFCNTLSWNKFASQPGATCIDHVIANRSAMWLVEKFHLLRNQTFPGHLPTAVTLSIENSTHKSWQWVSPPPYPVDDYVDQETDGELADYIWSGFNDDFESLLQDGNTEAAWQNLSKAAELYHRHKAAECSNYDSTGSKHFHRGQAPTFAFKDICSPVKDPILGAALQIDTHFITAVNQALAMSKLCKWCDLHTWRPCDVTQFNNQCNGLVKTLAKLGNKMPEMLQIKLPCLVDASRIDLFVQILTFHRVSHHVHVKNERVRCWRLNMRRSLKTGGRAACRWIAALSQKSAPIAFHDEINNTVTTSLDEMFEELFKIWTPIFNTFRDLGNPPTWEHFKEAFAAYLPQAHQPLLDPLSGDKMAKVAKNISASRAGGLDSWRTREVKALPLLYFNKFASLMSRVEAGAKWPDSFLHVPLPFLRKDGNGAKDGRLLMLSSSWQALWTKHRHADLSEWRQQWLPPSACGGKPHTSISDVYWDVQLDLEYSCIHNMPRIALLLDRTKCFDRFSWPIMFDMQRHAGCPEYIVSMRERWYSAVQPRFKLRGSYSAICPRTNGGFQGCTFTIDDCNLLMCVWSRMQSNATNCLVKNYFDDSTTLCSNAREAKCLLEVDEYFDQLSGQLVNFTKSAIVTNLDEQDPSLDLLRVGDQPLAVLPAARLVGASISATCGANHTLLDARIQTAVGYLRRVRFFPVSMFEKVDAIGLQTAAKVNVGMDVSSPSKAAASDYKSAFKQAILPPGCRAWTCMATLKALVIKAHRVDLDALQAIAAVKSAAKALRTSQDNAGKWLDLFNAQGMHSYNSGLICTFRQVIRSIKWKWVSPFVVRNDLGWEFSLTHSPLSQLGHFLRDSLRRFWLRKVNKQRPDMFGLAQHAAGVDIDATCRIIRNKCSSTFSPLSRVYLCNYLTGSIHTQHRMVEAGFVPDKNPLCPYCDQEIEDTLHILFRCPCWEEQRQEFRAKSRTSDLDVPPCTLAAGIMLQEQELLDAFHEQVLNQVNHTFVKYTGSQHPSETYKYINNQPWLLVGTDGSGLFANHSLLARAGAGVFVGTGHPANCMFPVRQWPQSSQRGEVSALLALLQILWHRTLVYTDSDYVCQFALSIINNNGKMPDQHNIDNCAHYDLWSEIAVLIESHLDSFLIVWHPSHLEGEDIANLGDPVAARLNQGADLLAGAAAKIHLPSRQLISRALRRIVFADLLQRMCVSVLGARKEAKPLAHRTLSGIENQNTDALMGDYIFTADSHIDIPSDDEDLPISCLPPAVGGSLASSASSVQLAADSTSTDLPAHSFDGALVVQPCAVVPAQLTEPLVVHHPSLVYSAVPAHSGSGALVMHSTCNLSPAVPAHSRSGALVVHSTCNPSLAVPAHSRSGALVVHSDSD